MGSAIAGALLLVAAIIIFLLLVVLVSPLIGLLLDAFDNDDDYDD